VTEPGPSWADHIVAEFADGHPVEAIAWRYGLTADQVLAVVAMEVGPGTPPPAGYYSPPAAPPQGYYAPPPAPPPGYAAPPAPQTWAPPAHTPQSPPYTPQGYQPPAVAPDEDTLVAEYADGHPVEAIAYRHGLTVDHVYQIIQRSLGTNP